MTDVRAFKVLQTDLPASLLPIRTAKSIQSIPLYLR
jgi:hypothetical protein